MSQFTVPKPDGYDENSPTLVVSGRYWHWRRKQWVGIGFYSMEDAEEWMTSTGNTLHNLRER